VRSPSRDCFVAVAPRNGELTGFHARRANHYFLSTPCAKNISLVPSGKSGALVRASRAERGALANVINAERDAVDADAPNDERR
jgi:hypothetical protein